MTPAPLVFANFLAPNMNPTYAYVAERVGTLVGRRGVLGEVADERLLVEGRIDVGFLCGLPYVRLARRPDRPIRALAAPIVDEPRYQGRPIYFSDVIARRDSRFQAFADLRGAAWAHNLETSFSGCVLTRFHLLQMGETERFFGRVAYTGSHETSIRAVVAGEVDASAIDSHVLGVELRRRPELAAEIRVIEVLGPSTIPPVVVSNRLPAEVREAIRDALCGLSAEPSSQRHLAGGLIQRFVPIDDQAYDDIRRKLAAVEAVDPRSAAAS
jgi:phosphonate transport system substrate-binding protein